MNQGNRKRPNLRLVDDPPALAAGGGGDGDGTDARLREIESRLREVEKDVVEVKTTLKQLATREDIARMQLAIADKQTTRTRWLITGWISIVGIVIALISIFN